MIPEISGPSYLKKKVESAWGRAEREWQRDSGKRVSLPPIIFWNVWRALFRELPGVRVPLTRDAVEDFREFVSAQEIQKAIDMAVDVLDIAASGVSALRNAAPRVAPSQTSTGRGPYRLPLERRIELIRFVWDNAEAFTNFHLAFGALGYEPGDIDWRKLWEKWNREKPSRAMANPGQLRDEFKRITNKAKYGATVREFFGRLEGEVRALAVRDVAEGKHFTESEAMMYGFMERESTSEGEGQ